MTDRKPPSDPQEWLNRARSNLKRAKADFRLEDVYLEDLCFDAQQAVEKAIKAILIFRKVEFPYIHDLARLLTILEESGLKIPDNIKRAETLTPFAVMTRYPAVFEPVTEKQYKEAVELAANLLHWVEKIITEEKN